MPGLAIQYCERCGRAFRPGQTRYLVTINLVADFDGTIEPGAGADELPSLWTEIEDKSEDELFNEVVQKLSFILCKPCRDQWAASPLGELGDRPGPAVGQVH